MLASLFSCNIYVILSVPDRKTNLLHLLFRVTFMKLFIDVNNVFLVCFETSHWLKGLLHHEIRGVNAQAHYERNHYCFLFLCYSWECQITLYANYTTIFSQTNMPKLMSESAVVQFPEYVDENISLWPLVADIAI